MSKRPRTEAREGLMRAPTLNAHTDKGLELILQTFTHKSLGDGNNERLAILGKDIIELAVTTLLYERTPILSKEAIREDREEILTVDTMARWCNLHDLPTKLRYHPDVRESVNTPEGHALLFYAYTGAAFSERGLTRINSWISALVAYDLETDASSLPVAKRRKTVPETKLAEKPPPYQVAAPPPPPPTTVPPPVPIEAAPPLPQPSSQSTWASQYAQYYQTQPMVSVPHWQPPQTTYSQHHYVPTQAMQNMHVSTARTNPVSSVGQSSLPFLALFNQTASQRRVAVSYAASFVGPTHAGIWTIRCQINGIEKGLGTGPSKSVAKEEAARIAYFQMGWAPSAR